MDVFADFHPNKGEEMSMFREDLIVVSDDGGFFSDIGKSDTQDGAHFCKEDTELI